MKKSIIFLFTVLIVTICFAQETKDVTKFMGIPVDGSKSAMIQKLKSKGFIYDAKFDWLKGEFNGYNVLLKIETTNEKVNDVIVTMGGPTGYDESLAKITFNNLSLQFEENPKYVTHKSDLIEEDENISCDKVYVNVYLQNGDIMKPVFVGMSCVEFKYLVAILYRNEYNAAHGEDL